MSVNSVWQARISPTVRLIFWQQYEFHKSFQVRRWALSPLTVIKTSEVRRRRWLFNCLSASCPLSYSPGSADAAAGRVHHPYVTITSFTPSALRRALFLLATAGSFFPSQFERKKYKCASASLSASVCFKACASCCPCWLYPAIQNQPETFMKTHFGRTFHRSFIYNGSGFFACFFSNNDNQHSRHSL